MTLSIVRDILIFVVGQDVLPLNNNFPAFKLFPSRSDSIDNSNNRASPLNNGVGNNPKNISPNETDEAEFRPIAVSPFRLFGTSTTVSTVNTSALKTPTNTSLKKFSSTTDKPRRKRTPKIDDNNDGQKVKRRRSEMTMNQKQLTLTELQTSVTSEKKVNPDASTAKVRKIIAGEQGELNLFFCRVLRIIEKLAFLLFLLLKVIQVRIPIIHLNHRRIFSQIPNQLR